MESIALLAREPFETAERALAQGGVEVGDADPQFGRDDVRGFLRARQIARDDPAQAERSQRVRDRARLRTPRSIERNVGVALPSLGGVPVRFAMADEVEKARGHDGDAV